MSYDVIKIENLSKQYKLGLIGTGTLTHDLNRWWYKVRGLEDPYLRIGEVNDRTQGSMSGYVWALKNINLDVNKGEVLGIIGKNGAGKSTLLKILSRVTGPTSGDIKVKGRIGSLLEVGTGFHPELTGRENVFLNGAILGMKRQEIKSKLDEIVEFSGTNKYIDTPVKRYSSGMKVRLAFSVAAHLEPEILVVDEVLAVGDAEFQKKALGKLRGISEGEGRTVLFVSHNLASVKALCTRAIVIENGSITFSGQPNDAINTYVNSSNSELKNNFTNDLLSIEKVSILSNGSETTDMVFSKEDFRLNLFYKSKVEISHFNFIFNFYDQFDTLLFQCKYIKFEKIRQKGKLFCEIPKLPLTPGEYKVGIYFKIDSIYPRNITNISNFTVVDNKSHSVRSINSKNNPQFFVTNRVGFE